MNVCVREMELSETGLIIEYFYNSSAEYLEILGVDPTRFPARKKWYGFYENQYALPIEERESIQVLWEVDKIPFEFSTADKIVYGREAFMHLHIWSLDYRQRFIANNGALRE